jgi:hypothetical protein
MSTVTLRIPDDKHERLKRLVQSRGIRLNKLMEEWATIALAEFDAKTRFMALAAGGKPARGLELLDKLDQLEAR